MPFTQSHLSNIPPKGRFDGDLYLYKEKEEKQELV